MNRILMFGVSGGLKLERRVLDRHREVTRDAALQIVEQLRGAAIAEAALLNDDMCGDHRQVGRNPAGVKIMHLKNPGQLQNVRTDLIQIQASRRGLQQHAYCLPKQLESPGNDQSSDQHRHDCVSLVEAGEPNDNRADDNRHGTEGIVHDLKECGTHIEVSGSVAEQNDDRRDVRSKPDYAEDDEFAGSDLGRSK